VNLSRVVSAPRRLPGWSVRAWPGRHLLCERTEPPEPSSPCCLPCKGQCLKTGKRTTKLTIFTPLPAPFLPPTMFPQGLGPHRGKGCASWTAGWQQGGGRFMRTSVRLPSLLRFFPAWYQAGPARAGSQLPALAHAPAQVRAAAASGGHAHGQFCQPWAPAWLFAAAMDFFCALRSPPVSGSAAPALWFGREGEGRRKKCGGVAVLH